MARRIVLRRRALRAGGGRSPHDRRSPTRATRTTSRSSRGVTPQIPGFTVEVLNGDDRLEVRQHGHEHGHDRRLQRGAVHPHERPTARSRSTCARRRTTSTRTASTARTCPTRPTRRRAPQWKRRRARPAATSSTTTACTGWPRTCPPQVNDEARRTKIFDWNVPLRAGAPRRGDPRRAVLARRRRRARRSARSSRSARSCCSAARPSCVVRRRRPWATRLPPDATARGGLVSAARALAARGALLAALLLAPAGASAHALLVDTVPQRGATLREQPRAGRAALQRVRRGQLRRGARLRRRGQARRRRAHGAPRRQRRRGSPSA